MMTDNPYSTRIRAHAYKEGNRPEASLSVTRHQPSFLDGCRALGAGHGDRRSLCRGNDRDGTYCSPLRVLSTLSISVSASSTLAILDARAGNPSLQILSRASLTFVRFLCSWVRLGVERCSGLGRVINCSTIGSESLISSCSSASSRRGGVQSPGRRASAPHWVSRAELILPGDSGHCRIAWSGSPVASRFSVKISRLP
jgi:hypothetical protein